MSESRVGRGALVTLVMQWSKYLIQVLTLIVLSRLLSPDDYGLVAMALTVAGLANALGNFGLSLAALQAPTLTQSQKSNLFWLNGLLGVGVAAAVASFAGPLAVFYRQPGLVEITLGISVVFALNGFSIQFKVDVNRSRRFVALGMIDLLGQVAGFFAAVSLAIAGAGYWSLVSQQIVGALVGLVAAVGATRWRPSMPSRQSGIRPMLKFGRDTLGINILNYVTTNVDSVVVGRQFGPAVLGLYSRAYQLVVLPLDQVLTPLNAVFIPRLAELSDAKALITAVSRLQLMVTYGIIAPFTLVWVAASPLLEVALGEQWSRAGGLVRVLIVGGVFQALSQVYYWVFIARGHTRELLFSELCGRIPMVLLILLVAPLGVHWVASAVAAGQIIIWLVSTIWFAPRIGLRTRTTVRSALRPIAISCSAGAASSFVGFALGASLAAPQRLILLVTVWLLVIGLAMVISRSTRRDVQIVMSSIRK